MVQRLNRHFIFLRYSLLLCLCSTCIFAQQKKPLPTLSENEDETRIKRNEYELSRLMDPATRKIPENIRAKELKFSAQIPTKESLNHSKNHGISIQSENWISRGPSNIGGRTYAIGIDVRNENIILAGSTSGGMYRSMDRGSSWKRTTSVNDLPSVRSLVQDTRPGKTNTWYYGTGEMGSNTAAYPLWLNYNSGLSGQYYGNGIYKSTDDGQTWFKLKSTATLDSASFNQPFNFVNKLVIDPSDTLHDIIYAAVAGGIERSSDGGNTWTMVLGNFPNGSTYTDVGVTSKGIVYAAMCNYSLNQSWTNANWSGVNRSLDGIHWSNITPSSWSKHSYLVSLAIAPSNQNIIYVGGYAPNSSGTSPSYFLKYTSGASNTTGIWEDRSDNYNQSVSSWNDVLTYLAVNPDDENIVYTGGLELWRSTDAFKTTNNVSDLCLDSTGNPYIHVDHETIEFFPSNPSAAVIGCDGGLYSTEDVTQKIVIWNSLDNNYLTAQFYTVAIDHSNENDIVIGGMQDNSIFFTNTKDETLPWIFLFGGDGSYCAMSRDRGSYYVSEQDALIYREILDDSGNLLGYTRVDPIPGDHPIGGLGYLFINPFALDPNNTDMMYLAAGQYIWRNSDLTMIPMGSDSSTSINWTKLTQAKLPANSPYGTYASISAFGISTTPANIVYYGSNDGQVYRIDSANTGNPKPVNIWKGKGFPAQAYVSCIAVDPHNASNAIMAFANYNVQSLFYTSDGGSTWAPIGGNLEEHPNGTGNGPSCRWVSILHVSNGIVYLVGTSTGLYSTSVLNAMSTVWSLEGTSTIGNNIVNMMDVRESDGEVAIATCGNGVFTGNITSVVNSVNRNLANSLSLTCFPNPATTSTRISYSLPNHSDILLQAFDVMGREVARIASGARDAGAYEAVWDTKELPTGSYIIRLTANGASAARVVEVVR